MKDHIQRRDLIGLASLIAILLMARPAAAQQDGVPTGGEDRTTDTVTVVVEPVVVAPQVRQDPRYRRQLVSVLPFIGLRTGRGPDRFLVGLRGDIRAPGGFFRILPEASLGFGEGAMSYAAFLNGGIPVTGRLLHPVEPYIGVGIGLLTHEGLSGFRAGLNLMAGVEYWSGPGAFFLEYSTIDVFDYHRGLLGYRLRF
jgi:hypothetical protein